MRANQAELQLLAHVRTKTTFQELQADLDLSPSYLSELVSRTADKNLVRLDSRGRERHVHPSDSKAVELFHALSSRHDHVDWPGLLAGKAVEVLYELDQPRTIAELADRSNNHRNTVRRILQRFQEHGIISQMDEGYALTDTFTLLHTFAKEYVHHIHHTIAAEHATNYTILWETTYAMLIQTKESINDDRFHETGPRLFTAYDLPLLATDNRYYLYTESDWTLTPDKLICHTVLIDTGPRYQTYCLLLMATTNVDPDTVRDTATRYGVTDSVDALLTYWNTQGEERTDQQPSWDELAAVADDYGVDL